MKIAVLGTGMVGQALAGKLVALGHEVMMGAREAGNAKAADWAAEHGAQSGSFAQAAAFGEVVIFATLGAALIDAARMAGPGTLAEKVVIDVTNPLDMSGDGLPTLLPEFINTTSAGEALQAALPGARVVKALNTMNASVMVDPSRVPGEHDVFYASDDADAKTVVADILRSFGWAAPIDLGPLAAARGTEAMMLVWLRLWGAVGHADFNYKIMRAEA